MYQGLHEVQNLVHCGFVEWVEFCGQFFTTSLLIHYFIKSDLETFKRCFLPVLRLTFFPYFLIFRMDILHDIPVRTF